MRAIHTAENTTITFGFLFVCHVLQYILSQNNFTAIWMQRASHKPQAVETGRAENQTAKGMCSGVNGI